MNLNIFKANKRISELETDNSNLQTQLIESQNLIESLQKMSTDFVDTKASMEEQIENLTIALEDIKSNHAKEIEDLQVEVQAESVSATKKAADIVASIGVEEEEVPQLDVNVEVTPDAIYSKFMQLNSTDKEAAKQFYNDNREVIKAYVGYRK